jgi:hypothetical protein
VQITAHELTVASSGVAALAIVGGYLGVRSANHTAVAIARDERSARRRNDLDVSIRRTRGIMTTAPYLTSANVRAPHGLTEHGGLFSKIILLCRSCSDQPRC